MTVTAEAPLNRVAECLLAYYPFTEGGGTTAADGNPHGHAPLDLSWSGGGVSWLSGRNGVAVTSSSVLRSTVPADRIKQAVSGSGELTVELWATPASLSQRGPSRMLSFSKDPTRRAFTLGQADGALDFRLRTTATSGNGIPSTSAAGAMVTREAQYVATFSGGTVTLYRDGQVVGTGSPGGAATNWEDGNVLVLANEATGDRAWLGQIYLAAVYGCALTPAQVQKNFEAGSDPGDAPVGSNPPPEFLPLPESITGRTDELLQFQIRAEDPDGDTVSYRLGPSSPAGMQIDASSGQIRWTPPASAAGRHVFTVLAMDDGEPIASAAEIVEVVIEVGNQPPQIVDPGSQSLAEQQAFTLNLRANDPNPGQTLTWSLVSGPSGAALSPAGQFTWTPREVDGGQTFTVSVKVRDNGTPARQALASFDLVVREVNRAPTMDPIGDTTIKELVEWAMTPAATDTDIPTQTLTWQLRTAPVGALVDPETGVVRWTPTEMDGPGAHDFELSVTDGIAVHSRSFSVTVAEVNRRPTLAAIGDQTVAESDWITVDLLGSDPDLPAQPLTYRLVSGPNGMVVDDAGPTLRWRPTEGQGRAATSCGSRSRTEVSRINAVLRCQ